MVDEQLSYADRWMRRFEAEHPEVKRPPLQHASHQLLHQSRKPENFYTAMQSINQDSVCLWLHQDGSQDELDPVVESAISTRRNLQLTQAGFSRRLGISVRTLRDWEQGRRCPSGAARTLLALISQRPELIQELNQSR